MPNLDNTMGNFMECSQMMFGATLRYCITYKSGQPDFTIYTRNCIHNFQALLANSNYEGSIACNLGLEKKYVIGEGTHVRIHDMNNF